MSEDRAENEDEAHIDDDGMCRTINKNLYPLIKGDFGRERIEGINDGT